MEDFKALHVYRERLVKDNADAIETRVKIAKNFLEVRNKNMDVDTFYKELAKMEMPAGREPRHALMLVKRDIIDFFGTDRGSYGQKYFFGEILQTKKGGKTVGGGTEVERFILQNRRQIVFDAVEKVLADFAGRNVVDNVKYSIYLAEIGGWAKELPEEMKLAGDIDFSFFCGNVELAMALKVAYDQYIFSKYGMTPEEMDIPCTAHGRADYEVYVEKHGQAFAEKYMKKLRPVNLDPGAPGSRIGEGVDGKHALTDVLLEQAKLSKTPLANLQKLKWPTEPGISLEMIRHFEHDIVAKDVYSDLESFVKAAKYTERSMQAVIEAGGKVVDEDLSKFCTLLVENKTAPPDTLANIIRGFFKKKGIPLPYEVDLAPSKSGHAPAVLKANKGAVTKFWDTCRKAMWENVETGFGPKVDELHARVATMDPASLTPDHPLAIEMKQLWEMMEVQSRIMHHEGVGVKEVPKSFDTLMSKFRLIHNDFLMKAKGRAHGADAEVVYKAAEELLNASKTGGSKAEKLGIAVAAIIGAIDKANQTVDFIDNTLLDGIKTGTYDTHWYQTLKETHQLSWSKKVNDFIGDDTYFSKYKLDKEWQQSVDGLHEEVKKFEVKLNAKLLDNCVARGVRGINQSFNRSLQASTSGQYMMKGLMLINLKSEITTYTNLIAQGKWQDLGTEVFKKRVPGGTAVENIILGKYLAASWDIVKTLLPVASLFDTAAKLGMDLGKKYWEITWDEELEKFIDALYEDAEFKLMGVDHIGEDIVLSRWLLISVTYRGEKVDIENFFAKKERQIQEMYKYLQGDKAARAAEPFPIEYTLDGITGWVKEDWALRENIGQHDPFLTFYKAITDKKENKVAGPRLREYFKELWYTRWEKVKLEFLRETKKRLEKRRSAEQAHVSGQVPKMLEELMKIAKDLRIKDEVEESLEKEVGGDFIKFVYWLGDLIKGVKRDYMGEADVWDVYEENARVIEEYLRVYKLIHKNREEAEKHLEGGPSVFDAGLRLLTGKYFLTGKASKDEAEAPRWARLPVEAEVLMEEKIREIKSYCNADNPELERDEMCFDQIILREMVYHHVFKECWKHVWDHPEARGEESWFTTIARGYVDFATPNDEVAEETSDFLFGDDENTKTDQDLAKEQHEYHAKAIKDLIAKIEGEYCTERQTRIEELLKMTRYVEKLSEEVLSLCQTATSMINTIKAKLDGIKKPISELEIKIKNLTSLIAQTQQIKSNINFDHGKVENFTTKLGEIANQLDEIANYVCEKVKEMQDVDTNSQRDTIYRDINRRRLSVRENYNLSKSYYRQIKDIRVRTKKEVTKLEEAKKSVDGIKNLEEILKTLQECDTEMDVVLDKIAAARQKVEEIPPVIKDAKDLAKVLRKLVKPMLKTESGKEAWEKISECLKRIDKAYEACKNEPAKPDVAAGKLKPTLKNLDNRANQLKKDLDRLRDVFGHPEEESQLIKDAKEKLGLIEYLEQMAIRYVERIAMSSADADYCFSIADGLKDKPISYVLPNFSGQGVNQAMGVLQRVGLGVNPVEQRAADHPDKEYAVFSQMPQPGVEVKIATTTVTLNHYGALDVNAYLRNVDCSRMRGSTPQYDPSRRKAVCVCQGGLVANTNNTECINCQYFQQNFMAALNAGNVPSAQTWLAPASNCPFYANGRSMLNEMIRQKECRDLEGRIIAAARNRQVTLMNSLMARAQALTCPFSPDTFNLVSQTNADENRRRQEEMQQQTQNMINMWNNILNPNGGGGYYPPIPGGGGGGYNPPPGPGVQLTSRTIVGRWSTTGRHNQGHTHTGSIEFFADGNCRYDFHDRFKNGKRSDVQGTGRWTLNQTSFEVKYDQGGVYSGTVRGDSMAFTLSKSNNGWTMSFRRM